MGIFLTWLNIRLATRKKTLGFEILTAGRLLAFKPEPGVIQIGVKTNIIKNPVMLSDPEYTPVEDVYSFRVWLQNKGNENINEQDVFVRLDGPATAVSPKLLNPDGQDTDPRVERSTISNAEDDLVQVRLRAFIPGEKLTAYIQSVGNNSQSVEINGPGITCFDMRKLARKWGFSGLVAAGVLWAGGLIIAFAAFPKDERDVVILIGMALGSLVWTLSLMFLPGRNSRRGWQAFSPTRRRGL